MHGLQATAERPRHPAHKQGPNPNTSKVHGGVVVGGWVSSPAGQNRRTVGHCGRTKLLLHARHFDTLGDPIELNENAKKNAILSISRDLGKFRFVTV